METVHKGKVKQKGKPRGKPIAKGQILNPGGRPRITPEELDLVAACKAKTPDALNVILGIMNHGAEKNSLAASQYVIERAYGKPVQPQDVNLSGGITFGWLS